MVQREYVSEPEISLSGFEFSKLKVLVKPENEVLGSDSSSCRFEY